MNALDISAPLTGGARAFLEAAERAPMKLPVWRRNRDLLDMLRIVSIERFRDPELRDNYAGWNETWHRTTGQVIEWAYKAPDRSRRGLIFEELRDLVVEARSWRPISGAIYAVSRRKSIVTVDGRRFTVSMAEPPDLEFLDMLLERRTGPRVPPPPIPKDIYSWFASCAKAGTFEEPGEIIWNRIYGYAGRLLKWQRSGLPEGEIPNDVNLTDQLAMGRCLELYASILSLRIFADMSVRFMKDINPALMSFTKERILDFLLESTPEAREIEILEFIDLMTYRPGKSAHASVSPFVPFDGKLVFAPALATAAGVERTLLRSVAADPNRFGKLGQRIGQLADRVAAIMEQIPNVTVMTRVEVSRADGTVAGDIDVLAVDAAQGQVLAVEVKWPIEALTLKEAAKIEADVRRGAGQLHRLRTGLSAGEVLLPVDAERVTRGKTWNWCVATPGQLAETGHTDIYPTSVRHMLSLIPVRSLSDLIYKLAQRPRVDEHYKIGHLVYERLGLSVQLDTIDSLIREEEYFG